jgi:hypothetical protein
MIRTLDIRISRISRALGACLVVAFVVLGLAAGGGARAAAATTLPRVDVYGDSVTWESQWYVGASLSHRANVYLHLYPGTSMCMWFSDMRTTAAAHPSMVLVTFGSMFPRSCDHTTNALRELKDDAGTVATIFASSKVVFASDPPGKPSTAKQQQALDGAYKAAVKLHKNSSFNYADRSVSPQDLFTLYLPCLPGETAAMGCVNAYGGVIKVRAPDGFHLCPVTPSPPGSFCPVYSSGERRFGTAVATPAVKVFPVRSVVSSTLHVPYRGPAG